MSARIPPGFAEYWAEFRTGTDPEPMFCSLGVDLADGVTPHVDHVNAITIAWEGALDDQLSSVYTFGPGYMLFGQDGGDIRIDGSLTPAGGSGASTPLPNNCALLIHKRTALGGRRGRGRMYVPGFPEGDVGANGQINTTPYGDAQANVTFLMDQIVGISSIAGLVLFHSSGPFTPTPITSLELDTVIGTQRRRMRR